MMMKVVLSRKDVGKEENTRIKKEGDLVGLARVNRCSAPDLSSHYSCINLTH
jgi:hypothetical protein